MAFGWEILNENGVVVADTSSIMSRKLGDYLVPYTETSWSITIPTAIGGGTPFAHCKMVTSNPPSGFSRYYAIPDIVFGTNSITISFNSKHFAVAYDDTGTANRKLLGNVIVNWGVYNK